jgi:hypothetical protein
MLCRAECQTATSMRPTLRALALFAGRLPYDSAAAKDRPATGVEPAVSDPNSGATTRSIKALRPA